MAQSKQQAARAGETHQTAATDGAVLTTNQGLPVADNQNSLKNGPRGPTLLPRGVRFEEPTPVLTPDLPWPADG